MKRLIKEGVGLNSPAEYDRIYFERKKKEPDPFDVRRWKKLLHYYKGGRLLDVGALDSLVPQIAREYYPDAEVWGIDVAAEAIKDMQERFPDIIYKMEDAYNTHFPKNYFQYIVAGEIIEHLDDPSRFIAEMIRILKRGGILAISTPEEEEREVGAVDHERHVWSINKEDLENLLKPHGVVIVRTMASQYFPTYEYHWPNLLGYLFKE